eukprot:403353628
MSKQQKENQSEGDSLTSISAHDQEILDNFDFHNSTYPNSLPQETFYNVRKLLLGANVIIQIAALFTLFLSSNFFYFTCWGMHIVSIALVLSIMAQNPKNKGNVKLIKWAGVINELALTAQMTIVAIYWPFLHHHALKQVEIFREMYGDVFAWRFHQMMIYIHIVPALVIFANVAISRIVMMFSHVKYMIYYGVIYLFFNYAGVLYLGRPLYPFLPWTDYKSFVVAFVINLGNIAAYYIVCQVGSVVRKNPPKQEKVENSSKTKSQ